MDSTTSSLWLHTAIAVAGWLLGMVLHLKWHPLRQHFSDAWNMLMRMPWLIAMMASLIVFAHWLQRNDTTPEFPASLLLQWRALVGPLALSALGHYAENLHGLLPARSLAFIMPFVLPWLTWRLLRWPYRYAERRASLIETAILILTTLVAWSWLALEVLHWLQPMRESWETLRLLFGNLIAALAMAMSQVALIRMVINWEHPQDVDAQHDPILAFEETAARWRSVFCLALLNLLWLLWADSPPQAQWLGSEAMIVFATLPLAVALVPGPSLQQGAVAMSLLLRVFLPWLGVAVTSIAVLMIVHYTCAVFEEMAGPASWMGRVFMLLRALVLATAHCWVFLATVFTFLRHGLKPGTASAATV